MSFRAERSGVEESLTITFGEGMDGYLNQPAYVGSVGFAVYNTDFFPDNTWTKLKNVYSSYDEMLENICEDIKTISSDKKQYYQIIKKHLEKLSKIYKIDNYLSNLKRFYDRKYDFVPKKTTY